MMSATTGCRLRFDIQHWWNKPGSWQMVVGQHRFYSWRQMIGMVIRDSLHRPKRAQHIRN